MVYFKVAIDNLEFCCMDPDMEHHYKELLHQWKNDEDTVKDVLKKLGTDVKEIGTDVKEVGTDVKEIGTDVKEVGTDVKEIGTDVKEVGTEVKEIGTDVREIGTDVKDLTKKLDEIVASTGTLVGQSSDEDGEYIETFKVATLYTAKTRKTLRFRTKSTAI